MRLDSEAAPALQTRVLFRMFRTLRPSLVYNTTTIYRRAPAGRNDVVGLLGVEGSDIISIPYFASDRVTPGRDMATQTDPANLIDIPSGKSEQYQFFGCWLDINRPDQKHFPANPGSLTDFSGVDPADLRSIQSLIGGFHQCVVAEVHYKFDAASPDLPRPGDTPATSDKLSQRNLALLGAANPGNPSTRMVQQSFEIKAPTAGLHALEKDAAAVRDGVDALVLWWQSLPVGTLSRYSSLACRARRVGTQSAALRSGLAPT